MLVTMEFLVACPRRCMALQLPVPLRRMKLAKKTTMAYLEEFGMIGTSKAFPPSLLDSLADNEVVVGTFHFGGTCVGLAHNHAEQRLGVVSVVQRCTLAVEKNDKGPDGQQAIRFSIFLKMFVLISLTVHLGCRTGRLRGSRLLLK